MHQHAILVVHQLAILFHKTILDLRLLGLFRLTVRNVLTVRAKGVGAFRQDAVRPGSRHKAGHIHYSIVRTVDVVDSSVDLHETLVHQHAVLVVHQFVILFHKTILDLRLLGLTVGSVLTVRSKGVSTFGQNAVRPGGRHKASYIRYSIARTIDVVDSSINLDEALVHQHAVLVVHQLAVLFHKTILDFNHGNIEHLTIQTEGISSFRQKTICFRSRYKTSHIRYCLKCTRNIIVSFFTLIVNQAFENREIIFQVKNLSISLDNPLSGYLTYQSSTLSKVIQFSIHSSIVLCHVSAIKEVIPVSIQFKPLRSEFLSRPIAHGSILIGFPSRIIQTEIHKGVYMTIYLNRATHRCVITAHIINVTIIIILPTS